MKTEEKEAKPRYGIDSLARRKYRRFPIRLPIEYYRTDLPINQAGQALDASKGGLQILFPEQMEIGQKLEFETFLSSGSEMNTIETIAEVVVTKNLTPRPKKNNITFLQLTMPRENLRTPHRG